jgi:hypothetical protein
VHSQAGVYEFNSERAVKNWLQLKSKHANDLWYRQRVILERLQHSYNRSWCHYIHEGKYCDWMEQEKAKTLLRSAEDHSDSIRLVELKCIEAEIHLRKMSKFLLQIAQLMNETAERRRDDRDAKEMGFVMEDLQSLSDKINDGCGQTAKLRDQNYLSVTA